jgi:hypothetical protein
MLPSRLVHLISLRKFFEFGDAEGYRSGLEKVRQDFDDQHGEG